MRQLKKIDLLLKEIKDPHAQENFYRLKYFLESLELNGIVSGPIGPQGPTGPQGPPGAGSSEGYVLDTFDTPMATAANDFVVVTTTNTVAKVPDNLTTTMPRGIFGVCSNKPTATTADVIFIGRVSGFSGLTVGLPVFVSTTGTATHTAPTTGMVQQIGFATSATEIFVNLLQPFRRA